MDAAEDGRLRVQEDGDNLPLLLPSLVNLTINFSLY
jgi:hypothetical protein